MPANLSAVFPDPIVAEAALSANVSGSLHVSSGLTSVRAVFESIPLSFLHYPL